MVFDVIIHSMNIEYVVETKIPFYPVFEPDIVEYFHSFRDVFKSKQCASPTNSVLFTFI